MTTSMVDAALAIYSNAHTDKGGIQKAIYKLRSATRDSNGNVYDAQGNLLLVVTDRGAIRWA